MHFHAWKKGLKTGMYYLRTKAARDAVKFTVDTTAKAAPQPTAKELEEAALACSIDNPDDCEMCSG